MRGRENKRDKTLGSCGAFWSNEGHGQQTRKDRKKVRFNKFYKDKQMM